MVSETWLSESDRAKLNEQFPKQRHRFAVQEPVLRSRSRPYFVDMWPEPKSERGFGSTQKCCGAGAAIFVGRSQEPEPPFSRRLRLKLLVRQNIKALFLYLT